MTAHEYCYMYTHLNVGVFLRSDAVDTIYFAARFVQLHVLFEGGVYFFRKPRDTNDGLDKVHTSKTVTVARHCQ